MTADSAPATPAPPDQGTAGHGRWLEPRVLGPLVGALAVALGLLAVHSLHGRVRPGALRAALAATAPSTLLLALAFVLLSCVAMACYDMVAARRPPPAAWPRAGCLHHWPRWAASSPTVFPMP